MIYVCPRDVLCSGTLKGHSTSKPIKGQKHYRTSCEGHGWYVHVSRGSQAEEIVVLVGFGDFSELAQLIPWKNIRVEMVFYME